MHRLLIISRPRILFENNAPFPLYRSYVFPSPQTCSFRFIFLVPGCFPFLRLFIFLLAPSPCFLSSLAARFPSFHSPSPSLSIPLFPSSVSTPHLLRYLSQFFSPPILIPPFLPLRAQCPQFTSTTLLPPSLSSLSSPAPLLVYCPPRSTLLGEGGEREEKEGGKNVVHSSTSSKFRESTCFASGTSLSACT